MENVEAITVGMHVRVDATTGREEELERFDNLPVAALQRQ